MKKPGLIRIWAIIPTHCHVFTWIWETHLIWYKQVVITGREMGADRTLSYYWITKSDVYLQPIKRFIISTDHHEVKMHIVYIFTKEAWFSGTVTSLSKRRTNQNVFVGKCWQGKLAGYELPSIEWSIYHMRTETCNILGYKDKILCEYWAWVRLHTITCSMLQSI